MKCACSNEERACHILPSALLHLTNCMLCYCKAEVNCIIPYIFHFHVRKSIFSAVNPLVMFLEVISVFLL